jgi:hypothetical protein
MSLQGLCKRNIQRQTLNQNRNDKFIKIFERKISRSKVEMRVITCLDLDMMATIALNITKTLLIFNDSCLAQIYLP